MPVHYDYLTVELSRGRPAWAEFTRALRETARPSVENSGGEILGAFAPQLGFASNEATVLIRWKGAPAAQPAVPSTSSKLERLTPTVRPRDDDRFRTGGIYVHRWFTVDGGRSDDFIDLSNRAWGSFEGTYDTQIFGLFTAERNETDRRDGSARLLLLTWYRNHGVWEASREQAQDAASLFAQRHQLTRSTVGRSSVLLGVT